MASWRLPQAQCSRFHAGVVVRSDEVGVHWEDGGGLEVEDSVTLVEVEAAGVAEVEDGVWVVDAELAQMIFCPRPGRSGEGRPGVELPKGRLTAGAGLAVLGQTAFIADGDNILTIKLHKKSLARQLGPLVAAGGIAVNATTGEVFASDCGSNCILVFQAQGDGKAIRQWGSSGSEYGQFDRPQGICVGNGVVVVADSGNNRIQAFSLLMLGKVEWVLDGLDDPYAVSFDCDGDLLVVDQNGEQWFGTPGSDDEESCSEQETQSSDKESDSEDEEYSFSADDSIDIKHSASTSNMLSPTPPIGAVHETISKRHDRKGVTDASTYLARSELVAEKREQDENSKSLLNQTTNSSTNRLDQNSKEKNWTQNIEESDPLDEQEHKTSFLARDTGQKNHVPQISPINHCKSELENELNPNQRLEDDQSCDPSDFEIQSDSEVASKPERPSETQIPREKKVEASPKPKQYAQLHDLNTLAQSSSATLKTLHDGNQRALPGIKVHRQFVKDSIELKQAVLAAQAKLQMLKQEKIHLEQKKQTIRSQVVDNFLDPRLEAQAICARGKKMSTLIMTEHQVRGCRDPLKLEDFILELQILSKELKSTLKPLRSQARKAQLKANDAKAKKVKNERSRRQHEMESNATRSPISVIKSELEKLKHEFEQAQKRSTEQRDQLSEALENYRAAKVSINTKLCDASADLEQARHERVGLEEQIRRLKEGRTDLGALQSKLKSLGGGLAVLELEYQKFVRRHRASVLNAHQAQELLLLATKHCPSKHLAAQKLDREDLELFLGKYELDFFDFECLEQLYFGL